MINFPEEEKKILEFWKKNKFFEKSLLKNKGKKPFVFFEGPPTANAKPGIHHVLARSFKDLYPRYKTMQGFYVERKAGWDTHGLPVELEVEKKLGLKTKKEIESFGIANFNEKCRENIWQYKKEWEDLTRRIGFWLDLENPYITYEPNYIETIWWILKHVSQKGLLYQDYKVSPYCPRCGTTLSSHELSLGYQKITEPSIYVKFKIAPQTFLLAWTTTPWTLPANLALAINKDISYVKVKSGSDFLILAEKALGELRLEKTAVQEELNAEKIIKDYPFYEPLFSEKEVSRAQYLNNAKDRPYQIVIGNFVSDKEGTGVVHIAPNYGEDDHLLSQEKNLPIFPPEAITDREGRFTKNTILWQGKFVKEADPLIIAYLEKQQKIFKERSFTHDYPFCWRCQTPLLYWTQEAWFIKMTALKDKLIEQNQKINWIPQYIKNGRFGEWLKELKDWNIARDRFWGTPLPIWQCVKCDKTKVIGSFQELINEAQDKKSAQKAKNDPHRPYIDEVKIQCSCGSEMKRVNYVLDVWFDSGAMPFAQARWPFAQNQKSKVKSQKLALPKLFPADYISEAVDQTRGWFYTLLAVSVLLGYEVPYKNVISLGHILDERGEKMSKSKGNVIDPWQVIERFGADALRWYLYTLNQPGSSKRFNIKSLETVFKKIFLVLENSYHFLNLYLNEPVNLEKNPAKNILDQWILARLKSTARKTTSCLNQYKTLEAGRSLEIFLDDLSRWYIRRSRQRFQKDGKDKKEAARTLAWVLLTFSKLIAPFAPFSAERVYQNLKKKIKSAALKESVHLELWPLFSLLSPQEKIINSKMKLVRELVNMGLALRKQLGLKVRQPLSLLKICCYGKEKDNIFSQEFLSLIKDELNIKNVEAVRELKKKKGWVLTKTEKLSILLNPKITPKLQAEGNFREILRQAQTLRALSGCLPKDVISLYWQSDDNGIKRIFRDFQNEIKEKTKSAQIVRGLPEKPLAEKKLKISGKNLLLSIVKIGSAH